jgi:hypothetical protein
MRMRITRGDLQHIRMNAFSITSLACALLIAGPAAAQRITPPASPAPAPQLTSPEAAQAKREIDAISAKRVAELQAVHADMSAINVQALITADRLATPAGRTAAGQGVAHFERLAQRRHEVLTSMLDEINAVVNQANYSDAFRKSNAPRTARRTAQAKADAAVFLEAQLRSASVMRRIVSFFATQQKFIRVEKGTPIITDEKANTALMALTAELQAAGQAEARAWEKLKAQ